MSTPTKTLDVTSQVSQTAKILTPPREMQTPDTTTDILEENMNFIPARDPFDLPTPEKSPEKSEINDIVNWKNKTEMLSARANQDKNSMKKCEKCRTYFTSKNFDSHTKVCMSSNRNENRLKMCENCKNMVDKTPQKFNDHVKRCKIYYKFITETATGFKCNLCTFEIKTKFGNRFDPR